MDINKLCPHCMKEVNKPSEEPCPHCGYDFSKAKEVSHQLKPYTILAGKYLVGDVLGEGGFGITYIGLDLNLEIRVAIKEFYPNGYATREAQSTNALTIYTGKSSEAVYKWRDNFLKEARSLAKCSHMSGVVGVREFFQENNTAYIVQEYLEGKTLKEYCKSKGGKLPVEPLLNSLEPVLHALGEVHKAGLIHRDISPDNIMLLKGGQMKLLDFGAARDFTQEGEKSLSVLLKPGYAPEEQYRSKGNQGPWSDIYALAGTIYKCITGITPPESMERMRKDELQKPSALGVSIPPHVEKALLKALEVYAEKRYQTVEEFHKDLYAKKLTVSPVGNTKPGAQVISVSVNKEKLADTKKEIEKTTKNLKTKASEYVQQLKKKGILTNTNIILLALICCVIVVIIAMILLLGKDNKQQVAEVKPAQEIEQSAKTEETSEAVETEEAVTEEETVEEAEPEYYKAKVTSYYNGTLRDVVEYDKAGNEVSHIEYDGDGNVIIRFESEYDSAGNCVNSISYNGDGSVKYSVENKYDNIGRHILNTYISYNMDGSVNWRSEEKYNSAGNRISYIVYNTDGSISEREEREYDSIGNEVSCTSYNADGSINYIGESKYDEFNNQISYVEYNKEGYITCKTESEYDGVGNQVSYIEYNEDGYANYRKEWEYDSAGNNTKIIEYDINNDVIYRKESKYDGYGNEIWNETHHPDNDEVWVSESEYDSAGNLLKCESYFNGEIAFIDEYNSNGEHVYSVDYYYYPDDGQEYRYEYKYDDNGNCLLYKKYYYPEGNIYELKEKKYDEQGRIVEERDYEYSGMAFGDFRIYYEYDDNGNLIKEEAHSYDEYGQEFDDYDSTIIYEYKLVEESATIFEETVAEEQEFLANAALEMYRDFLLGNVTADYQGNSLNYDSLMPNFYVRNDSSEPPRQTFTLADSDKDNVPELKVNFWSLENDGLICTVKLQEEHLEITEMDIYGYMDHLTVYKDGSLRFDHGLSASSQVTWFESATGEHLATFEMLYYEHHGENTTEDINAQYERWTSEGYEYVYVTSDDQTTWEEFENYIAIYLSEHGKEAADLYEVNEESIQSNMKW